MLVNKFYQELFKMKVISFAVPCYNSEKYMKKCIDSLLIGGDDIEIIIVNDGSSDSTAEIADSYKEKYPEIVKVIHKENGGHGSGVNAGLKNATGVYFKVVDSDDWVDKQSLIAVIKVLKEFINSDKNVDLLISNYVYEHVEDNTRNAIKYVGIFPENKICSWYDMKRIDPVKYIIMHSMTYRTEVLRQSGLVLPEHTFYVDNLVVFIPLPLVKKLYYLNVDFYRYYIGRSDQSVNEKVMIKRIDQQIRVTNMMLNAHDFDELRKTNIKVEKYLVYYLSVMYTITTTLIAIDNSKSSDELRKKLWQDLKSTNKRVYRRIRYFSKAFFMSLPGKLGKATSRFIYRIARKVYKFN